ncbi:MAG: RcnB family protein [Burkholderiales bacterium]|nr:RcnB family protein [Burkholderiales bacterium]
MKSKTIICAIAAASFGFGSMSFAQTYDRHGQGNEPQRGDQHPPMGRDGHDAGPRGMEQRDHRDHRNGPNAGARGFERQDADGDRQYGARGPQFHRGGRIPQEYRNRQYVVNDWRGHHLNAPPRGHQWVQVGADYVLIAIATGVIAQLVLGQ